MKIFLAGMNGRRNIPKFIHGGGIFNLDENIPSKSPFATKVQKRKEICDPNIRGGIFSEDISSREHDFPEIHCPEYTRGGFDKAIIEHKPFILESFYYTDEETEKLLPLFGDFLLDSGAFTFMQNATSDIVWEEYIERYADFIKRNKVEKFFELDIDPIVGYDKVKYYRQRLETLTGRPCIPVWHKSRGIDEFYKMCDEYGYGAIGGVVTKEISKKQYDLFPIMIKEAHKRKCRLHGLGFTNLSYLPKCHFDSVDSTAWTAGNRFGYVYKFDGKTMRKIDAPSGKRLADPRRVALNNYIEWIKFQKYAEANL